MRAGDNLYTSSIVALELKTGRYRWHFQQVHHDIWDYDSPSPVVLFDLEYDGRMRKGLAQASKTGWVYILDRTDGTPLVGIDEKPVPQEPRQATAATQPYPRGDAFVAAASRHRARGLPARERRPHLHAVLDRLHHREARHLGRRELAADRVRPRDGLSLSSAPAIAASSFVAAEIGTERPPAGECFVGGAFGTNPLPAYGTFTALDMRTNTIVWQQHWANTCYSGATATAGGLVFVGRNDGRLTALDSATARSSGNSKRARA